MREFSDTEADARFYWRDTKRRLKADGFELWEKISPLKLPSSDGKSYKTDVADAQTCLRIVQAIPSPKAEPIRQWLAQVGVERLEERANPELGVRRAQDRAAEIYQKRGKDDQWIAGRLIGISDRKAFTDALAQHVAHITGATYGKATNAVYKGLWGRSAGVLKQELGISKSASLRDHQPSIANHYQALCEITVTHLLGSAETVTPEQALTIIQSVARVLGVQASELGALMEIDPATGKPLLEESKD
ncbi:MAG: hypothetical protein ABI700_05875 [Chloroflexota bacterium]